MASIYLEAIDQRIIVSCLTDQVVFGQPNAATTQRFKSNYDNNKDSNCYVQL